MTDGPARNGYAPHITKFQYYCKLNEEGPESPDIPGEKLELSIIAFVIDV